MINKEKHYRDILKQLIPDDTNPANWKKGKVPICH